MEVIGDTLILDNEDDAWNLLEDFAEQDREPQNIYHIEIRDFNFEIMYFPDEPVGHSLTAVTIKSLDEFNNELKRGYTLAVYKRSNKRLLRKDDYDALNIKIVAKDGSTGYDIVKDLFLDGFIGKAIEKMTGEHLVVVLVFLILCFFGNLAFRHFLTSRTDIAKEKINAEK